MVIYRESGLEEIYEREIEDCDLGRIGPVALVVSGFSATLVLTRSTVPARAPTEWTFVVLAVEYKGTSGPTENPPNTTYKAYRWDPSYIRVSKGDTVRLNIFGVNGASHPSTIDAFDQSFTVTRGQWTNITFVASKAGIAEMVCHVPDHTETMQMVIEVFE